MFIFVAKLTITFDVNKRKMGKSENVNPMVYYQNLSKKEKSQFLLYLSTRYCMKANTISRKLAKKPNSKLNKLEEVTIQVLIEEGLWKR